MRSSGMDDVTHSRARDVVRTARVHRAGPFGEDLASSFFLSLSPAGGGVQAHHPYLHEQLFLLLCLTHSFSSSFKNNKNETDVRPWRHFGVQKSANEPIRKHLSDQVGKRSGQILHLVLLGEEIVLRVQGAHEETRDGVQNHVG